MPRKYTIRQFEAQFPDDKACLAFLFKARWPQGAGKWSRGSSAMYGVGRSTG